jgi:hypothetical protein
MEWVVHIVKFFEDSEDDVRMTLKDFLEGTTESNFFCVTLFHFVKR